MSTFKPDEDFTARGMKDFGGYRGYQRDGVDPDPNDPVLEEFNQGFTYGAGGIESPTSEGYDQRGPNTTESRTSGPFSGDKGSFRWPSSKTGTIQKRWSGAADEMYKGQYQGTFGGGGYFSANATATPAELRDPEERLTSPGTHRYDDPDFVKKVSTRQGVQERDQKATDGKGNNKFEREAKEVIDRNPMDLL